MKKIQALLLVLSVLLWANYPYAVFAANGAESFDSYADEDNLTGLNGGSGWGEAWQDSGDADDFTVESTACHVNNCVVFDSGTDEGDNERAFSAGITNGSISVYGKRLLVGDINLVVELSKNDGTVMATLLWDRVGLGNDATLIGASAQDLGDQDGTFQEFLVQWGDTGGDGSCAADQMAGGFDGGTFGACQAFANSQTGNVEQIRIRTDGPLGGSSLDEITIIDVDAGAGGGAVVDYFPDFFIDF